ncbi:hypothetical protein ARZXY2_4704 (plasmid) [Arthrobacter sp. ZXY-2]|nr:hypothetical protein ARZXY2_4704 [Arthrobacter sp. ZXY-2]
MTGRPEALAAWVAAHPRQEAIHNHGFRLNLDKWNALVGRLPGTPLVGEDGGTDVGLISRGGLFQMAEAARRDDSGTAALGLFWHSLAWGTGSSHRNTPGRIRSVTADITRSAHLLRDAAHLAVNDPRAAFLRLQPGRTALKYWGPNFFTKYLYFAGAGAVAHPCLIVDARVLATLYAETGDKKFKPASTSYAVTTYLAACEMMRKWAGELSSPERPVGADEVERWAFNEGRGWRGRTSDS